MNPILLMNWLAIYVVVIVYFRLLTTFLDIETRKFGTWSWVSETGSIPMVSLAELEGRSVPTLLYRHRVWILHI